MMKIKNWDGFCGVISVLVMICFWSCTDAQKQNQDEESNDEASELTLDEADRLISSRDGSASTSIEEMFRPYKEANELLVNKDAPHNQGNEPLVEFVDRFSKDVTFQQSRTHLNEHSPYPMEFSEGILEVLPPDSTNFFASWREIQDDQAAFCNGWLGSEMNKELIFCREKDGLWYLVEYFSATKEL